ncbi:MAG: SDR family oxidoreductase [Candidatus Obscuribacterales bacterium]|nr:SDR family oxidoreductase [Candidatus Obscuribacterales bacterium]
MHLKVLLASLSLHAWPSTPNNATVLYLKEGASDQFMMQESNAVQPKRCVVTGGAGFIGSHLVERLLTDGHAVTVLDNFSSGHRKNLQSLSSNSKLKICQVDIAEYEQIKEHFVEIDWVFHLAALADIVPSIEQPLSYHRSNVDGTISVLEAARQTGVKRFIYAASSSCYGLATEFPTPETAAIKTEYPYALTKYLAECYVLHWNQVYKLPCISLRLINVYGPRARTTGSYGAVFGVFLAQKLAGRPYTVVGDGNQTRDFTFVSDVVQAFIQAAQSELSGEIFNVGSGGTYSINKLIALLGGDKVHIPKRPGEPDCTFACISKISKALGWQPQVGFEEGVAKMLEHIDDWREAPVWDEKSIDIATRQWFEHLGESKGSETPHSKHKILCTEEALCSATSSEEHKDCK